MEYQIYRGDVLEVLKDIPDETYTCALTDPPYGLGAMPDMAELLAYWLSGEEYNTGPGFMGKNWDVVPGPSVWKEVYRVCKPGAVLMAFGGTRTFDLLSIALRLAGFEMYDVIMYMYGSGFNKVGYIKNRDGTHAAPGHAGSLKPAYEPVLLCRRPRTKTYARHAVEDGTGALWVDGCRIEAGPQDKNNRPNSSRNKSGVNLVEDSGIYGKRNPIPKKGHGSQFIEQGRWPANIIHDGSDEVAEVFARAGERLGAVSSGGGSHFVDGAKRINPQRQMYGDSGSAARFFQICPQDHPDAARFFYASKASRRERNAGLEGMPIVEAKRTQAGGDDTRGRPLPRNRNHHPCIKPLSLCEYLSRLILPPVEYREDARLLVPFAGSMSEAIGAMLAGWINIDAIELDEEYAEIGHRRFEWWSLMKRQTRLSDPAEILARVYPQDVEEANDDPAFDDLPLFAELS